MCKPHYFIYISYFYIFLLDIRRGLQVRYCALVYYYSMSSHYGMNRSSTSCLLDALVDNNSHSMLGNIVHNSGPSMV